MSASPQQQMANLNAILRWSIEHGHKEDAPADAPSYAREMTAERRAWLQEALAGMVDTTDVIDVVAKRLQGLDADGVTPLQLDAAALVRAQEETLEEMLVVIDNIDFAKDFGQIGGAEALLSLLQSPHAGLRWRAAEVVATVVQNNPACQDMMLGFDVLNVLAAMVESDADARVRTKALLAIASQVRGHAPSMEAFLGTHGGLALMRQVLEREAAAAAAAPSREARKILFLVPGILDLRPTFARRARDAGLVDVVFEYCFAGGGGGGCGGGAAAAAAAAAAAYEHSPLRESALRASIALFRNGGGDVVSAKGMKRRVVERVVELAQLHLDEDMAMVAQDEAGLLKELAVAM